MLNTRPGVRRRIARTHGRKQVRQIASMYAAAYEGTGMTAEEIWEEVICDSLGDMNIFAGKIVEDEAGVYLTHTKSAAQAETVENRQERGPPDGRMSRDLDERRRALRKGEMVNEFRDRVNWRKYYQKIMNAEYNPEYFDDGAISMMELDGALLTLEMQRNGEWSVTKVEEISYGSTKQGRKAHPGEDGSTQIPGERKGHGNVGDPKSAGQRSGGQRSGNPVGQKADGQRGDESGTEVFEVTGKASRELHTSYLAAVERGGMDAAQAEKVESRQERGPSADGKTSRETADRFIKEELQSGETRKETRQGFLSRGNREGYAVFEGETVAYGYKRRDSVSGQSVSGDYDSASETQRELSNLGIDSEVITGPVLWNRNGVTASRIIQEAATIENGKVLIDAGSTENARNVAGHEAFHVWRGTAARQKYSEILEDNLIYTSKGFLDYQSKIAAAYLGGEVDLADPESVSLLKEELFAYLSGDIHEGGHDRFMRSIFRDYDAVRQAWADLVQSAGGKSSLELDNSTSITEGQQTVQTDIQAEVREEVRAQLARMGKEYGFIPPGENPARVIELPRRTAPGNKVSQTARTILEAEATPDELVPSIENLVADGILGGVLIPLVLIIYFHGHLPSGQPEAATNSDTIPTYVTKISKPFLPFLKYS